MRRPLVVFAVSVVVFTVLWRGDWHVAPALAEPTDESATGTLRRNARVILITLDGPVRDDVFSSVAMPKLHAALSAKKGVLLEGRAASSMALSLPGYQALATGVVTDCLDNDCPRVGQETVSEFLARRLGGPVDQFAVFASWSRLRRAATSHDGAVLVDAPDDTTPKPGGPRWRNARFDSQTFDAALAHWQRVKPRFLQISFLDTDEWAHAGFREEYEEALREADTRVAQVMDWIDALPPEEKAVTTLIITADHGRGRADWREHGFFERGSGETFFAAFPARGVSEARVVDQRDVRPTIERLFGFCTEGRRRRGEGRPLSVVVGELPCAE
ncbi:MAG: alkaline phosphatase family protein [Archangium sp.]